MERYAKVFRVVNNPKATQTNGELPFTVEELCEFVGLYSSAINELVEEVLL